MLACQTEGGGDDLLDSADYAADINSTDIAAAILHFSFARPTMTQVRY